jgi:hypothetical protein
MKRMTGREVQRLAKFRAGLLLASVLDDWEPEELIVRIGWDDFYRVQAAIGDIARGLEGRGWTPEEIERNQAGRE